MQSKDLQFWAAAALAIGLAAGCSQLADSEKIIRSFPADDLDGVCTTEEVSLDPETSHDGDGSLRITAVDSTVILLYEVDDLDLEDALLSYRAFLRTRNLQGSAYLLMHVRLPEKGEYAVGAVSSSLSGTADWAGQHTAFLLREGQKPDRVRLNLAITGPGTVWIDEILLTQGRLPG